MAIIKLPRLTKGWREQPELLERYWDIAMSKLEDILNQLIAIPLIEAALADLDAATTAAAAAAANANAAAEAVTSESSLVNSFVDNFVAPLISADNLGDITIATHDRVYGDSTLNPTVSVTGAVVSSGAAPASVVRIYYNDPARAGGAVTYLFTVDPAAPPVQGGNVHSVGAVTIPAAGTQGGNGVRPPGYVEP